MLNFYHDIRIYLSFIIFILVILSVFCNNEKKNNAQLQEEIIDSLAKGIGTENDEITGTPFEIAYKRGEKIYTDVCKICHQKEGQGVKGIYPPFAQADYLMEDVRRGIRQALFGSDGTFEMTVNGIKYKGVMLAYGNDLNDEEIAAVLTYITNSWGNKHGLITAEEVAKIRKEGKKIGENY